MSALHDFVRADSNNLPDMDMAVILEYFLTSNKHNVAEIRAVKSLMASKNGYVQIAVGYVELQRDNTMCTVRAKVVPERKIYKKYYMVTVHLNEKDSTIIDTECDGCPALAGGCKHILIVLFWLEKKSTGPSPTSVECYWKKPLLARGGIQPILAKDITKNEVTPLEPKDPAILNAFLDECKKRNIKNSLILSFSQNQDSSP